MSSTLINIPSRSPGITEIISDSPEIVVVPGKITHLSFDNSAIIAASAASIVTNYTAGETIPALKAVYISSIDGKVYKGETDSVNSSNIIGITKTAGDSGDTISVLQYGIIVDPFFNFSTSDILFLGSDGAVQNTSVNSGYLTRLGKSINSNSILVSIEIPIQL